MSLGPSSPITQLLAAAGRGDVCAREKLWTIIYGEVRDIAHVLLRGERPGRDLQTTIVAHEAYLRLMGNDPQTWANKRHFFGAVANAMRQFLADCARKRDSLKRGGGRAPVELTETAGALDGDPVVTAAFNEAMEKLKAMAPREAEVLDLRCFAGRSVAETAELLGIKPRTVEADLRTARAWLARELAL